MSEIFWLYERFGSFGLYIPRTKSETWLRVPPRNHWLDVGNPWQTELFHLNGQLEEIVQTVYTLSVFSSL